MSKERKQLQEGDLIEVLWDYFPDVGKVRYKKVVILKLKDKHDGWLITALLDNGMIRQNMVIPKEDHYHGAPFWRSIS